VIYSYKQLFTDQVTSAGCLTDYFHIGEVETARRNYGPGNPLLGASGGRVGTSGAKNAIGGEHSVKKKGNQPGRTEKKRVTSLQVRAAPLGGRRGDKGGSQDEKTIKAPASLGLGKKSKSRSKSLLAGQDRCEKSHWVLEERTKIEKDLQNNRMRPTYTEYGSAESELSGEAQERGRVLNGSENKNNAG